VKQLAEDFAKYLYLPRLRDSDVLVAAIRDGLARLTWQTETFAYADDWDEQKKRYKGLQTGQGVRVLLDGQSLLVRPDAAVKQVEADRARQGEAPTGATAGGTTTAADGHPAGGASTGGAEAGTAGGTAIREPPKLRRFHGAVRLDAVRLGRDAARVAEEVVQRLSGIVGANVEVTLEIRAEIPDGASEKVVRDVTENCRTLRFDTYGFEEA
jgi:hypothetical protein